MRLTSFLLLVSGFLFALPEAISQTVAVHEEFDSPSLNPKRWTTTLGWGPNISMQNDEQIFLNRNAEIKDGKLLLTLKEEPGCYDTWRFCDSAFCNAACVKQHLDPRCTATPRCEIQGGHCLCLVPKYYKYTGALLASVQKYSFGIFEIRCKVPKDCSSAFWLYGDCCQEIDVFEMLGCEENNPSITIHQCPQRNCSNNLQCGENFKTLQRKGTPDLSTAFHTWKLDWKKEDISVYLDNELVYHCKASGFGACLYNTFNTSGGSCTIGTHTLYPDGPMQFILNIATNTNDCLPPVPSVFEIEYVKIWQY